MFSVWSRRLPVPVFILKLEWECMFQRLWLIWAHVYDPVITICYMCLFMASEELTFPMFFLLSCPPVHTECHGLKTLVELRYIIHTKKVETLKFLNHMPCFPWLCLGVLSINTTNWIRDFSLKQSPGGVLPAAGTSHFNKIIY